MHLQLLTVLIPLALAQLVTSASANEPKRQVKKGTVTMTVSLNNQNLLMPGKGKVHLAVDLKATTKSPNKRLPMNLALVIDRSGSMRGEKIEKTREAARHLIKQLSDKDFEIWNYNKISNLTMGVGLKVFQNFINFRVG